MKPDIDIKVRFKTTLEDGRKTPIIGDFYACPMILNGKAFDCRLLIKNIPIELGQNYEIPVKFLNKELAITSLYVGMEITLWEGKEVATGQVVQICK